MSQGQSSCRQGRCCRCRILWTWTMAVLLRDQVCRVCFRPLTRVGKKARESGEFTALTLEGYRTTAEGYPTAAEGYPTTAEGYPTTAEGYPTAAMETKSQVEKKS